MPWGKGRPALPKASLTEMTTATKLTQMGQILDALSRARVLLTEHRDLPPSTVFVHSNGRTDLDVTSQVTYSEEARRHAVDVLAEAAHLAKPTVKHDEITRRVLYLAENDHWRIATPVKAASRCKSCGGALT